MSLDAIYYAWPEILTRAKVALSDIADLLDSVHPQEFSDGRLEVSLAPDAADQVADLTPDRLGALASIIEEEAGLEINSVSLESAEGWTASKPEPKPKKVPRDPLADMEGEQISFELRIKKPPGLEAEDMIPWRERRPRREKMVKERRAARAEAEAEAAEDETLVETDPALIDSVEGAGE